MGESNEIREIADVVEEFGLAELGYQTSYSQVSGGWLTVAFGHPLLIEKRWSLTDNVTHPGWEDRIREHLRSAPDIALTRQAAVIRTQSVPIVAALRHGAVMSRLRFGNSAEAIDASLWATSSATLALASGSVLTLEETDWLMSALETDQDVFPNPPAVRSRPEG
jgi:hypothetical protein